MANTFQWVGDWLAMEALRLLTNKLVFPQFFDTSYSKEFDREFAVGDQVEIKFKQQWRVRRDTMGYSPQAIDRRTTTVKIDKIVGLDFDYDSVERALRMERSKEEISSQYLDPAMAYIAQEIESECALYAYQNTPNVVGALGTNPSAMTTFGEARERLVSLGTPFNTGQRGMIIPPEVNTSMADALKALFQADDEISRQYKEGTLGRFQGFKFYESNSLYYHTAGTWAGAVTVSGAGQTGSSLVVAGTNGDTFKVGDKFSIANVFAVNPMTRRAVSKVATKARTFTVLADATVAGGVATLSIYPAIEPLTSQYQNVDALPANGAALTLWPGTASPNGKTGKVGVALHDTAFALVGVKLEMPKSSTVEIASQQQDPESGLSVSFIRDFDPKERKWINRYDVLFGFGKLHAANTSTAVAAA